MCYKIIARLVILKNSEHAFGFMLVLRKNQVKVKNIPVVVASVVAIVVVSGFVVVVVVVVVSGVVTSISTAGHNVL